MQMERRRLAGNVRPGWWRSDKLFTMEVGLWEEEEVEVEARAGVPGGALVVWVGPRLLGLEATASALAADTASPTWLDLPATRKSAQTAELRLFANSCSAYEPVTVHLGSNRSAVTRG